MRCLDVIDRRLLDEFQRSLPLVSQPFARIAAVLGVGEVEVIARLLRLQAEGSVARVGATVRPNTMGASTLAALAVPQDRIEAVAAVVNAERGVNHSYLRENEWNLWFVATAGNAAALEACLARIGARTGLSVLNLPLVRAFNIDLGFRLTGIPAIPTADAGPDEAVIEASDRPLLQAMVDGLPVVTHPFAAVAGQLGWTEARVLDRLTCLSSARILTRIGVIVRHRAIGWTANAMVVWAMPEDRIEAAGKSLAAVPGVTLCYQRRTVPGTWDFGLFSMIHGQSRTAALDVLAACRGVPALVEADHRVLFSTRCFKQTGALIDRDAA